MTGIAKVHFVPFVSWARVQMPMYIFTIKTTVPCTFRNPNNWCIVT